MTTIVSRSSTMMSYFLEHFDFDPELSEFTKEEVEECLFFFDVPTDSNKEEKEPDTGEAGAEASSFFEIQEALAKPIREETEVVFDVEQKGGGHHYVITVNVSNVAAPSSAHVRRRTAVTHFAKPNPSELSHTVTFRVFTPTEEVDVALVYDVRHRRWIPSVRPRGPEPSWTYDYDYEHSLLRIVVPEPEVDAELLS